MIYDLWSRQKFYLNKKLIFMLTTHINSSELGKKQRKEEIAYKPK